MKTICTNCVLINNEIYSYDTLVATVEKDKIIVPKYHSVTTSKHINKVADFLGLEVEKQY